MHFHRQRGSLRIRIGQETGCKASQCEQHDETSGDQEVGGLCSNKGIKLIEKGKKEALAIIRKHRLTELILVKVMGLGWEEVHDIARTVGARELITLLRTH